MAVMSIVQDENVPPQNEPGTRILLLVEDSEDDARLALRALGHLKSYLDVHWAKDGHEAKRVLGLIGETPVLPGLPDLIICDVKMPRVGGPELLQSIRSNERFRDVPVVMFSTSTHEWDVERCMQLGASDYCFKPFDLKEFSECVRGIAERWLTPAGPEVEPNCLVETSVES